MLTRLAIKNFKSIGDPGVELELRPLTFLVGPNGSGKSSVLEALALLAQSVESYKLLAGRYRGRLVQFPSSEAVVYRHDPNLDVSIELDWYPARVRSRGDYAPSLLCSFFFRFSAMLERASTEVGSPECNEVQIYDWLNNNVWFLSARVRATYGDNWLGSYFQETLAKFWGAAAYGQREFLSEWAVKFGLRKFWFEGWEGKYEDVGAFHSVLSSSYGSSQAFPVIVNIADFPEDLDRLAGPRDLLMIEDPEISLHPEAQVEMAELLATATQKGKQVLATTHSTFLLMALRKVVAKGILTADNIAVYELTKGAQGTTAKRLPLHKEGYIEGWVPSFGNVEKDLLQGWLDIIPKAE